MTVGAVQLYNGTNAFLLQNANHAWDLANSGSGYMFLLARNTYTPADAHATVSQIGTAGVDWINTGDGSALAVPTRSVVASAGAAQLQAGDANFGASVTISAKYLVCVRSANVGAQPAGTDDLIFWVNLRTEDGAEVSSTASDFVVQAPAGNIWWAVNAQA